MLPDVVAFQSAIRRTSQAARAAWPDAPVVLATSTWTMRPGLRLRQRLSLILRGLADAVEPAPTRCEPVSTVAR